MCRFFSIILLFPTLVWGQINESFGDGNFSEAPAWLGCTDHFTIDPDLQLQLMAPEGSNQSWLFTPSVALGQAEWSFTVHLKFNPSSNNFTRIYLAADEANPERIRRAIYIELGKSNDAIQLYALENTTPQLLISSPDKRLDQTSVSIQVKVSREGDRWQLDTNTGEGWQEEGQADYSPAFPSTFFGLCCQFTPTRSDKFFFDDIIVTGIPYSDTTKPRLLAHEVLNGSRIQLNFSEAIQVSPIQHDWFYLSQENRYPEEITSLEENQSLILLYNPGLPDMENAALHIQNISDQYGNRLQDTTLFLSYKRVSLKKATLIAADHLQLDFSKAMNDNFTYADVSISPGSFTNTLSLESDRIVQVRLSPGLQSETLYTLYLNRFQDSTGDTIAPTSQSILYYEPQTFDVVFSELMIDPSPSAGLPETEYIEIFNRSTYPLDVSNWRLLINNHPLILPDCSIPPNAYLLLCPSDIPREWASLNNAYGLTSWRNLTNEAGEVALITSGNRVMDALKYNMNSWAEHTFKDNGGWSFECIDPSNRSASVYNWAYSVELTGGTPGYSNSLNGPNPDTHAPQITAIEFNDASSVSIHFSEPMKFRNSTLQNLFAIKNQSTSIQEVHYDTLFLDRCTLFLEDELRPNIIHHITQSTLTDFAHNKLQTLPTHRFGHPSQLDSLDVIINEVLFNPKANGVDFIELYNRSQNIINLSQLYLGLSNPHHDLQQLYPISKKNTCIFPGDYLTITPDPIKISEQYRCEQPEWLHKVSPFPNLPNEEGYIALCLANGKVLDFFHYQESMHFPLLNDVEGISLERLSPNAPTNHPDNWHSASAQNDYGTPTAKNSQDLTDKLVDAGSITLHPELFTPNADGTDDQLIIQYHFNEPGTISTAIVYNHQGHPVKHLYSNQLCGLTGFNTWDGTNDDGQKVAPGIYIILVKTFSSSGNKQQFKNTCIVGLPPNN